LARRVLLGPALIAILLAGCATPTPARTGKPLPSGWSRFTRAAEGFSIAAPKGWQQKTVPSGAFTLVDNEAPELHAAMHVEETQEAKDIFGFQGAVDSYVSQIESDGTAVSRAKVKLPAGQAERLQYTTVAQTSIGAHPVTYTEFVLFHYLKLKGTVFHLAFVTLAENAGETAPTFQQIAESFQYLS
jgi:hypothetical protein